jgi:hypothetical protein
MRSQYDLRFQAPDEKYDLAGRAESDGSVLDALSEKAIPQHQWSLPGERCEFLLTTQTNMGKVIDALGRVSALQRQPGFGL